MAVEIVKTPDGMTRIQPIDQEKADGAYYTHIFDVFERIGPLTKEQIDYQFSKHGIRRHDLANWGFVITEEQGEIAQACMKKDYENAKFEIAQTIACLIRMYVEVERVERGLNRNEKEWYTQAV